MTMHTDALSNRLSTLGVYNINTVFININAVFSFFPQEEYECPGDVMYFMFITSTQCFINTEFRFYEHC